MLFYFRLVILDFLVFFIFTFRFLFIKVVFGLLI